MRERIYQSIIAVLVIFLIGENVYFQMGSDDSGGRRDEAEVTDTAASFDKGIGGVSIQVRIKEQTSQGEFNDSLYYAPEEWMRVTSDDVRKSIQKRVDNWVNLTSGVPAH